MTTKITPTNSPYTVERPFEDQTVRFTVTFKDCQPKIDTTLHGNQIAVSDFPHSTDEQSTHTFFQDQQITFLKGTIVFLPTTPVQVCNALKVVDRRKYSKEERKDLVLSLAKLTPLAEKYEKASDPEERLEACLELGQAYFEVDESFAAIRCYNEVLTLGNICNKEHRRCHGAAYLDLSILWVFLVVFVCVFL